MDFEMPVDYRHLQEKVEYTIKTGDEPYQHVFQRRTPNDVVGAVEEVKESYFFVAILLLFVMFLLLFQDDVCVCVCVFR
jgi:hypothetical protein